MKCRTLMIIIALAMPLFMLPSMAIAEGITISNATASPQIWAGDAMSMSCSCQAEGNASITNATARITGPVSLPDILLTASGPVYSGSWTPSKEGNYNITVSCNGVLGNGTAVIQSQMVQTVVKRLSLEIKSFSPQIMYTDQTAISITTVLSEIAGSTVKVTDPNAVSWKLVISGSDMPIQYAYDNVNSVWVITASLNGSGIVEGNHTVSVEATYAGKLVSNSVLLQLRKALFFNITSLTPANVLEGEDMYAKVVARYHDIDVFPASSLGIAIGGISVTEFTASPVGDVKLKLPNIGPGNQRLVFSLYYNGIADTVTMPFTKTNLLSGSILDSDGNPVPGTKLTFKSDAITVESGLSGGVYSARIIPGTYTVTMENAAELRSVEFSGVELDGDGSNFIRLDSLSEKLVVNKIRVASAFAMEFSRPFTSAKIKIRYDPGKVMNESRLKVYACTSWEFRSRLCNSGWVEADGFIDIGNNLAEVEAFHFSAFMVGEEEQIKLDASLDKGEYYLGDRVTVLGTLRTDGGSGLSGVQVSIRMNGQQKTAITNSGGVFSEDLFAPDDPGEYTLEVTSDAAFSAPIKITKSIMVVEKRELSLLLPVQADLAEASDNLLQFSVVNSGQKPLEDIAVVITGVPEEWLSYSPQKIVVLEPGQGAVVSMKLAVASSAQKRYAVTVKATSGGVVASSGFDVNVKSQDQSTEKAPLSGFVISTPFMGLNDLLNLASMIAAFMVLFSMVFFSRKRKPGHARPEVSSFVHGIRQEVMKDSPLRKTREATSRRPKRKGRKA